MLLRVSIEGPALAAAIGQGATAYRRSVLGLLGELCGAGSRRSATITVTEDGCGVLISNRANASEICDDEESKPK